MFALSTFRVSPFLTAAILIIVLLVAACAPEPTPTPTPAPTTAPTAAPTEEPTEVPTEVPTQEPAEDADADATEAVADADADAPADADDDSDAGDSASGEGEPGVVGVTSTRVRTEPSSSGEVLAEIARDTPVVALGQTANAGYLFVRLEDGTEGWVSKQTINLEDRFAQLETIEP